MIDHLKIVVAGEPRAKSRPRFTRAGGVYSAAAQVAQEQAIGWALRAALRHQRFDGPVHVHARFYRSTKRIIDIDNLLKLALDAGNRIAWADDRQVIRATCEMHLDKTHPRTEIEIFAAPEGEP